MDMELAERAVDAPWLWSSAMMARTARPRDVLDAIGNQVVSGHEAFFANRPVLQVLCPML